MTDTDRALGMGRPIARRDVLHGAGALLAMSGAAWAGQDDPGYDPSALTGLRGSHPGSFEAAHALRDGAAAADSGEAEAYDLVVVGGGISGLAAAWFWRRARPGARVLILDNHDDFGGHAKRNTFTVRGRRLLMNGGTLEIDSPRPYSAVADGVLRALGIDPVSLEARCADKGFYERQGLGHAVFLDRETFGADHLMVGAGRRAWRALLAGAPLAPAARADIARIYEARIDYMPGLSSAAKKDRLSRISYNDYLAKVANVDSGALPYFQAMSHDEWGVGADAVSALDVWAFEFPGFQGLGLAPGAAPRMGYTAAGYAGKSSYTFHFPDGNATIARLLVRALVPGALAGRTAADSVMAACDYAALDREANAVRVRLSCTATRVRDEDGAVTVSYLRDGQARRARAGACVLACYNMMIPYLCPDLPETQKQALHALVKIPMVYTSVAITHWDAFRRLGFSEAYCPGGFHSRVSLNPATAIGLYRSVGRPDAPTLVHMVRVPVSPGQDERTQHRVGRAAMLALPFEAYERAIRDQLGRMLGPGGFDPARDITAITVNRWPHGYAYEYNPLFDPEYAPGQAPHEIGRARFGRIAIANSDAGAAAYTDSAIDQAHRAVGELLGG